MANQGAFIVIEGTDGSGKGTQTQILVERLQREGYSIETFDFPQYDNDSSFFVREYLNGKYGTAEDVGPYTGSLFFALDRYEAAPKIRGALEQGKIVIANRFTASNMAHQGTKFDNDEQRRGFFLWLDQLEFEMLKIPRPDLSIVLQVPAEMAQQLVDKKEARAYTDKKRDLHEADIEHLQKSVEVYNSLCQLFPKDFKQLDCTRGGALLEPTTIHKLVWETVLSLLPSQKESKDTKKKAIKNQSITEETKSRRVDPNQQGKEFLEAALTNIDGNVYAFRNHLPQQTIAAAMARLSRRGDDMRIILIDEFAADDGKDEQLLKRVITAYGDDSVQQLAGLHLVIENASNILTKKLEWGRLAAYLEQSTRYIFFDQKDANGNYRYYIPPNLDPKIKAAYCESMDSIFDLYSDIVRHVAEYIRLHTKTPTEEQDGAWRNAVRAQACDAARAVLPAATTSTVGIYASAQAVENLIIHLLGDPLEEARTVGNQILIEARKVIPTFLERVDKPDRGGATIAYRKDTVASMKNAAAEYLSDSHSNDSKEAMLSDVWPRNELDIVPDMLYEYSEASLAEIRAECSTWAYNKKSRVFETYMGERLNRRHRPGRAIEKIHYSFDLLCDYGIFRDLQRHRMVDDLNWQHLTPRYGYEVPALIEDSGMLDKFERCFDISLQLYSMLQDSEYTLEGQYSVLLGHKMRWKVTMNAREAFHFIELRTSPQGHPGYRKLANKMYEKICEVHPLVGASMKFVNQTDNPMLTRLEAEQRAQFKLAGLSGN